jgi:ABC-type enterochelin transport system permease subunit
MVGEVDKCFAYSADLLEDLGAWSRGNFKMEE